MALSIVDQQKIAYTTTATSATFPSITWSTGDLITIRGVTENDTTTLGTPTVTGLTFTIVAGFPLNAGSNCWVAHWQATAASASSGTVSITKSGAGQWGAGLWQWRGHNGIGNSATSQTSGAVASVNLTISAANSGVFGGKSDWNAAAGPYTGTPTVNVEREDTNVTNFYEWNADWLTQTVGTRLYGTTTTGVTKDTLSFTEVKELATATVVPVQKARRSLRFLLPRRARAVTTPQPGLPAPPVYLAPNVSRRPWRGVRPARARAVTTAQPGLPVPPALRSFKASRRPWRGLRPSRARVIVTPQPGPPAPPTYQPPNPSRRPWRGLGIARGRSALTPPPPPTVVAPSYIPPNPSRRPRFFFGVADRAHTTPTAVSGVVPYVAPIRPRRSPFLRVLRGRSTSTPPAPVVAPAAPYVAPIQPRRRLGFGFLDRGGRQTVTPPAAPAVTAGPYVAPTQTRRSPQIRIFRARTTATPPAPQALPPTYLAPTQSRRPWRGLRVAKARATVTPQPGLPAPPTWLPPPVRQPRIWRGLRWVRGKLLATTTAPAAGPIGAATGPQKTTARVDNRRSYIVDNRATYRPDNRTTDVADNRSTDRPNNRQSYEVDP